MDRGGGHITKSTTPSTAARQCCGAELAAITSQWLWDDLLEDPAGLAVVGGVLIYVLTPCCTSPASWPGGMQTAYDGIDGLRRPDDGADRPRRWARVRDQRRKQRRVWSRAAARAPAGSRPPALCRPRGEQREADTGRAAPRPQLRPGRIQHSATNVTASRSGLWLRRAERASEKMDRFFAFLLTFFYDSRLSRPTLKPKPQIFAPRWRSIQIFMAVRKWQTQDFRTPPKILTCADLYHADTLFGKVCSVRAQLSSV